MRRKGTKPTDEALAAAHGLLDELLTPDPKPAKYNGICLHCHTPIEATTAKEWSVTVRGPCPHCGGRGW